MDRSNLLTVGAIMQIGQVKEKITKEKGWEASTQKLIYSGTFKHGDTGNRLCRLSESLARKDADLHLVQARYYKMQTPLNHTISRRKDSLFA